jgi:broad-specificity NMP kinase
MPAPIIYINAMPGVGKLTIAKYLQPLLPGSHILHNHELIDPVEKHTPRSSARYQAMRAEYRQQRLKPIKEDPTLKDTIFIFTDSQTENNECVSDYTDLCVSTVDCGVGRRLYSVILECELEENERRLVLPGRGKGAGNGKLTDVGVLREYRSHRGVWKFEDEDEVVLDVTHMELEEAARRIVRFVEKREREGRSEVDCDEPDYSV